MNTASMEREAEVRIFLRQCANVFFLLLLIIIMVIRIIIIAIPIIKLS